MNETRITKRREFLKTSTGAFGAAALFNSLGTLNGLGADRAPGSIPKNKEGQIDYFNKLFPKKLAPGGILAVHNAIRLREPMKEFLEMIAKHPDFDSVILSLTMDDGFSVSYRHRT
jgi:hypothetical protein